MKQLWVFDFDGSLSEFVADRTAAKLLPEAHQLLQQLMKPSSNRVAIISSRTLEDLVGRIDIPGVYLGGSCGLFWLTPHGHTMSPSLALLERIALHRSRLLPGLIDLLESLGVEIEDKNWAVAAHMRSIPPSERELTAEQIVEFCKQHQLLHSAGQLSLEVSFDAEVRKVSGLKRLLTLIDKKFAPNEVVYVGDDENDAEAMTWLVAHMGEAIAVGNLISVPGSEIVADTHALIRHIKQMLGSLDSNTVQERS